MIGQRLVHIITFYRRRDSQPWRHEFIFNYSYPLVFMPSREAQGGALGNIGSSFDERSDTKSYFNPEYFIVVTVRVRSTRLSFYFCFVARRNGETIEIRFARPPSRAAGNENLVKLRRARKNARRPSVEFPVET